MVSKIMQVFYDENCLPFKDPQRSIHYPIVGSSFNGSSKTTTIRFYVDQIGGVDNVTWVAITKLPNGQIGNEVLDTNSAIYDNELGEHYIELSLSSFYTTLKGDIYISLNGYQGGIEVEQDPDTGIYSIYGTPTIQATGCIKIAINYAPQTIPGTHFNTSDLQQILGALSDKANIQNTIIVVDTISGLDPTNYNSGQLFYDKNTQTFYKVHNSAFEVYRLCIIDLNGDASGTLSNNDYNKIMNNDNIVIRKDIGGGDEYYYLHKTLQDDTGIELEGRISVTASGRYVRQIYIYIEYTTKVWTFSNRYLIQQDTTPTTGSNNPVTSNGVKTYVDSNFVALTGTQTITGQKTFSGKAIFNDANLYNGYLTTNSKNYFVRVGVTTGQYVTYKLPYNYSDVGSQTYTLITKEYVDAQIASIKENEITVVNTTTYPTLNDFLASTGEEGFIYLYPIDTSDLTKGYYRYVWENNTWLSLGTTEIDLSDYYTKSQVDTLLGGYVQKTQTIAGISLSGNITSQALTDALVLTNTTTDVDYILGE